MKHIYPVGIIGYGNMGACLGKAIAAHGAPVMAFDKEPSRLKKTKNVSFSAAASVILKSCPVVILSVKPQDIPAFIDNSKELLGKYKPLLISIAAGVGTVFFEKKVKGLRVIRVMPNLAAHQQLSLSFMAKGKKATARDKKTAREIFDCVGETEFIDERFLDKVTAITGSGPGYVFYFMDALHSAARALGFDRKTAHKMVIYTFVGALAVSTESGEEFARLIEKVASKKGTTEAALNVLKKERCRSTLARAVKAAARRAKQLNLK